MPSRIRYPSSHGSEVRNLVACVTLAVALPRLPFWPKPVIVSPLSLLPQHTFGWAALMAGLLLLATAGRYRLRIAGRTSAVLAFCLWVTLSFATSSVTSTMIDIIFAYALFREIIAMRNKYSE